VLLEENLMGNATRVGAHFVSALSALKAEFPEQIKEARGVGLMVALECSQPIARGLLAHLLEAGIVANAVSDTTLRFVPPLVVTAQDCDKVVFELRQGLRRL
jgi:acetylornithine/succinyldiaminopimelate/putrescine aminotransferase